MTHPHGDETLCVTPIQGDTLQRSVQSFRDLITWQKAFALSLRCHEISKEFPRDEIFGLTGQLRRAASSVASNVSEGNGRRTARDYVRFLWIANGSLNETETHLLTAQALQYASSPRIDALLDDRAEVGRLLGGLIQSVSGGR